MRHLKALAASLLCTGMIFCAQQAAAQVQRTTLYSFSDREGYPSALSIDAAGALYGEFGQGGPNSCQFNGVSSGCGAVFRLTPPAAGQQGWTQDLLYGFAQDATGWGPGGGLALEADGSLLGFDFSAARQLFELKAPAGGAAPWPASALFRTASQSPENLVPDGQGGFFALTQSGTTFGEKWALSQFTLSDGSWTSQTLFTFADGNQPTGIARDSHGAIYGVYWATGAIFQLKPPAAGQSAWTQTILHTFPGGTLGSPLFVDQRGAVYCVTVVGGTVTNKVFKLTPPKPGKTAWTVATIATFTKATGATYGLRPSPVIVDSVGNVFGVTANGGPNLSCASGCGTLFRLSPITGTTKYSLTILDNMGGTNMSPNSGPFLVPLVADKNGVLYGMTGTDQSTVTGGVQHFNQVPTVFQVTGTGYQP